jgi:hypothetical protein
MKPENEEMLNSLIKIKKLHLSEMEKKKIEYTNPDIKSLHDSIIFIAQGEITILKQIIKTEEHK